MNPDNVFVFVGLYDTSDSARADYEVLRDMYAAGTVGTYDAAVIAKNGDGKVHVHKHEKPTQHGAWSGLAVGALMGVVFPPSLLATGAIGAAAGGLIGHLARGLSREELRDVGQVLGEGEVSLVVIGESRHREEVGDALGRADTIYSRELESLDRDAFWTELDGAVAAATEQVAQ